MVRMGRTHNEGGTHSQRNKVGSHTPFSGGGGRDLVAFFPIMFRGAADLFCLQVIPAPSHSLALTTPIL